MKKTLIGMVVLAAGLPMAAMALPPVTLDVSCITATTLRAEYVAFMDVVDDDLDPALTDFESLTYDDDAEEWVWATGVPDDFKLALLGAAMCEDSDLADDFDDNKADFLTLFVDKLDALVTYGTGGAGSAQAKLVAGGVAVQGLFALGGVADGFSDFLDGALVGDYAPYAVYKTMIIAMCTNPLFALDDGNDSGGFDWIDEEPLNDVYDLGEDTDDIPGYIPYLCPTLAYIIQEDIGAVEPMSTARQFAFGMRVGFSNAVPALLSMSTAGFDGLTDFGENDLLADFREYQDQFGLFGLIFHDVIAGYAATLYGGGTGPVPAAGAYYAPVLDAGHAFLGGAAALAALELPELPVLGEITKAAEDQPFGKAGDYDGNDFTNEQTYLGVLAHGGGAAEFVAAASGADPLSVPAAGLIGLAALVSAIAGGGAFVLRKK